MESEFVMARRALQRLALNERAKAYVMSHPPLYSVLLQATRPFIGGEECAEAIELVEQLNHAGRWATLDFIGESTRCRDDALRAATEFSLLQAPSPRLTSMQACPWITPIRGSY
jgi:proline dehydrogenase